MQSVKYKPRLLEKAVLHLVPHESRGKVSQFFAVRRTEKLLKKKGVEYTKTRRPDGRIQIEAKL
jgi:hypothetical protein